MLTFTPLTDLLYTAPVPASMSLSPSTHRSSTFAPSTASDTSFFSTLFTMSAAVCQSKCVRYRSSRPPPSAGDEKSKRPRPPRASTHLVLREIGGGGRLLGLRGLRLRWLRHRRSYRDVSGRGGEKKGELENGVRGFEAGVSTPEINLICVCPIGQHLMLEPRARDPPSRAEPRCVLPTFSR